MRLRSLQKSFNAKPVTTASL
ncbi:hypothetical protein GQ600_4617 [Phytophthora cactorum]|nr:hypothetical protein GQ600_4617 [Phytophthora cactorum]